MKRSREIAVVFTQMNSIVANANFAIIGEHAAGKTKICRDSCANQAPSELWPPACCRLIFPFTFSLKRCHKAVATAEVLGRFRYLWPVGPFRRRRRRRYVLFD